jgi:copper(I)-binding protein
MFRTIPFGFTRAAPILAAIAIALVAIAGERPALAQHASHGKTPTFRVGALVIEAPWARATPAGAKTAAAYLKITNNGSEPDRLIGGSAPFAGSVEVHEMSIANGVMRMRRLEKGLEIKPGQTVELKPGGNHIMFQELRERISEGKPLKGTLQFEKAGSVDVEYAVAPIGGTPSGGHGHMKH